MIRALIIDDEKHCIDRLINLLQQEQDIDIINTAHTLEEAVDKINSMHPELIFLDVQIGDKTGFELLEKISFRDFDIIFTTAYETYAIQAIKCSAIDYLLKPIGGEDLKAALEKLRKEVLKKMTTEKLEVLIHNLKNNGDSRKKIIIPTATGFELLDTSNIIRCESNINYTTIYLKDKQKFLVAKTLKEIEGLLGTNQFFRVHNSHLINLDCIRSYHKGKGGTVLLNDGSEILVSTRRKDDFLRRLAQW